MAHISRDPLARTELHRSTISVYSRGCDWCGGVRHPKASKTYWLNSLTGKRWPTPDRETGARKRLAIIMARYPTLGAYVQGDPRGAALYILRPGDVPEGEKVDSYYSRALAVYR